MIEQIFGLIIFLAVGGAIGVVAGLIACIFIVPVVLLICWILDRLV